MTGAGTLARLILRRDRWRLLVWVVVLGLLPAVVGAAGADAGYPTVADKLRFAAGAANPAELAVRGPVFSATTGGLAVWTVGSSGMLIGAVVTVLLTIRWTRTEERSGRRELLAAGVVGRGAPLAAALVVAVGANAAVGLVTAVGLAGYGLPVAGSVAFGLAVLGGGLLFAALGALAAQLASEPGAARGIGLGAVAVLFALSAAGELTRSGPEWATPFGWVRRVRAFADERWWVLLPFVVAAVVLGAAAVATARRRDVDAGLIAPRPGRAAAGAGLRGTVALAGRLHRGWIVGWTLGMIALGTLLGVAARSAGPQLDTPAFRALFGPGDPAEALFTSVLYVMAQVTTVAVVAAVLRVRAQETAGLADTVLALPVTRLRWAGAHLLYAVAGGLVVLAGLGLGSGLAAGTPGRAVAETLAYAPACAVFAGLTAALVGAAPQAAAPVVWTLLAVTLAVDFLAEFRLAGPAVTTLSPFVGAHAAPVTLTVVAVALTALGALALRRRDLHAA